MRSAQVVHGFGALCATWSTSSARVAPSSCSCRVVHGCGALCTTHSTSSARVLRGSGALRTGYPWLRDTLKTHVWGPRTGCSVVPHSAPPRTNCTSTRAEPPKTLRSSSRSHERPVPSAPGLRTTFSAATPLQPGQGALLRLLEDLVGGEVVHGFAALRTT